MSFIFLGVSPGAPFIFQLFQLEKQAGPKMINVKAADNQKAVARRQLPVRKPVTVRKTRQLSP